MVTYVRISIAPLLFFFLFSFVSNGKYYTWILWVLGVGGGEEGNKIDRHPCWANRVEMYQIYICILYIVPRDKLCQGNVNQKFCRLPRNSNRYTYRELTQWSKLVYSIFYYLKKLTKPSIAILYHVARCMSKRKLIGQPANSKIVRTHGPWSPDVNFVIVQRARSTNCAVHIYIN